jgi:hypothetical protein
MQITRIQDEIIGTAHAEVTMIKIIVDRGRHAPQAFCDHCGKRIEKAKDGNYE